MTLDLLKTMKPISFFPNLKILSLANNQISTIEGLELMVELEELYLSQNCLTKISGIEN